MTPSRTQILAIINNTIRTEDIKRSLVYWYRKSLGQGEEIGIGPQTMAMPFEGTIVFVDLAPGANWAHPCLYLLIDSKSLEARVVEASFPPGIDQSDENYIPILRYGEKPEHERCPSAFDK